MPARSGMLQSLRNPVLRAVRSGLLCLLMSMVVACAAASDSGQVLDSEDGTRIEGEYIVELVARDSASAILERAFGDRGLARIDPLETNRPLYLIRLTPDPGPDAVRKWAAGDQAIRRVEPNYRYSGGSSDAGMSGEPGQ